MTLHFIRIVIISAVILSCIFLPFIPGNYDSLAVTISFLAQLLAMAGLLLVPVGLLWLIHELSKQRKQQLATNNKGTYGFAIVALVASCIVALVVSSGAFAAGNFFLGIVTLVFCVYSVLRTVRKIKRLKKATREGFNSTPLYLVCIPVVVVLFRFLFIVPATEFSRDHAIRQSERLIQEIEAYHKRNGHYPLSLLSVNKDYKPLVVGIKQYHYEPHGDAYNLYFEQFTYMLDTREIVMYNKLDEHVMTSHDMDLLEYSGEELNIRRGDRNRHDLPHHHWKFFWFD